MVKRIVKLVCKYIFLFIVGGLLYMGIELVWRSRTDVTSFFMGGIAFVVIGQLNEGYNYVMPVWYQMIVSGMFITTMEYYVGIIFNADHHIWDYSGLWWNVDGQVCLAYSLLWVALSLVGILLDDWLRYKFFGEEKPEYRWI